MTRPFNHHSMQLPRLPTPVPPSQAVPGSGEAASIAAFAKSLEARQLATRQGASQGRLTKKWRFFLNPPNYQFPMETGPFC